MSRALVFLLAALLPSPAQMRLKDLSDDFQQLVERVDPAVVQIFTRGYEPAGDSGAGSIKTRRGSGSGVVVDPAGYILTNAHVVGSARKVEVLLPEPAEDRSRYRSVLKPSGKQVLAEVVGLDRETDLAVLKIEGGKLPHLAFGDSEALRQGQLVLAFGSPFGLENTVTMGVVSSVARQLRADDPVIYIQTDASINPGNSGGPLVDAAGRLVGINTFILSRTGGNEGVGFAVPANIARTVYEQIRQFGSVRRGQIGVVPQTITPALAQALELSQDWGVILADVTPRSSAEAAGLEVKDVVLTFNGKVLENARQFGVAIYQHAGKTVQLEVLRGARKLTVPVAVLERPQDPDRILSLATRPENVVAKLQVLAVDYDERSAPMLPLVRKLAGVVVAGLLGEPSEQGLATGDVIYEVNNTRVANLAELRRLLEPMPHGKVVALQVERRGQLQLQTVEIE